MRSSNETQDSLHDPTKAAIHSFLQLEEHFISNCGHYFRKTDSFDDLVHFNDEEKIVTFVGFDCGNTAYTGAPTELGRNNRERKNISRSCKRPRWILNNGHHNCSIVNKLTSDKVLSPYHIYDMDPAAHVAVNCTSDRTLCPISILEQQVTKLEQTYLRCFLHCERWTVKGRDCASALRSQKEVTYWTDEWTKQLLRLESWVIFGSPEESKEVHHLWWTFVVFRCSYLFELFLSIEMFTLFFQKLPFVLFSDDCEWEVKLHQQLLCKVTLP